MKFSSLIVAITLVLANVTLSKAQTNDILSLGFGDRAIDDELSRKYISPKALIILPDSLTTGVKNPDALLLPYNGQIAVEPGEVCELTTVGGKKAALLIDFGRELTGALELTAPIRDSKKATKVRIRLGESVSEAMSDINDPSTTATNEHSTRDFTLELPWLGSIEVGNSGFRFARIDLVDDNATLPLKNIRAVLRYRDIPYVGSFQSSNPRLDSIWATGAYTVHLNMQNYLWDGVKRDRLVWVGDMHPELMTIANVFGDFPVVKKSLDFARDTSPLPSWMNGIAAYSMWWVLIHRDLYMHEGDLDYLKQQSEYMNNLFSLLASKMDGNKEDLKEGFRLLDWPTSEMPDVIHAGYQALMAMTMEAGLQIAEWTGDKEMKKTCGQTLKKLRKHHPENMNNKQAAAMLILSSLSQNPSEDAQIIVEDGPNGFSTFYGYYMLEALAKAGLYDEAQKILADYWGAMLDLGATTFWEDLTYSEAKKAACIDQPVPEGAFDIHADSGAYCYVGHRHSFCHGWASGPTAWLTRYVLGVRPTAPGFSKVIIEPHLGDLEWVEGTVPTPHGPIHVRHTRRADGSVDTAFSLPDGCTL